MYIDKITVENFRTFRDAGIVFCHADQDYDALGMPKPRLPNMNLLLGNNGHGKTSLLRAIALAALGPAVGDAGIFPYHLVRRTKGAKRADTAVLEATFTPHEQDRAPVGRLESRVEVELVGDLERLRWAHPDGKPWHPVFSSDSDAFFMVGYGSTRRVYKSTRVEAGGRASQRAQRVMGLFEDDYALRPLNTWLPKYKASARLRGRHVQVANLLQRLLKLNGWTFTGRQDSEGEYLFERSGIVVPYPALSDGYRAFLGWLADLLYHVCETCPSGKKIVENRGIVMVDEIDLHLHPKWQMTVLESLAKALPNIQFIFTSHSPLLVGTLEWMNIIVMRSSPGQASKMTRIPHAVHGLDADQILITDFFGLETTRAPRKQRQLGTLNAKARAGDPEAALDLLVQLGQGTEQVPLDTESSAGLGGKVRGRVAQKRAHAPRARPKARK